MHAVAEGRVDDVGLHHQVLVDEFGRVGVVGVDAAHLGGGQVDLVGLLRREEGAHGSLVGKVQFRMGAGDDALGRVALGQQLAHDGRADHAAMAGHVDLVHGGVRHEGSARRAGPVGGASVGSGGWEFVLALGAGRLPQGLTGVGPWQESRGIGDLTDRCQKNHILEYR